MASITDRPLKSGAVSYLAQITRRKIAFTESKKFSTRKAAERWAAKREKEIDADIAAGKTPAPRKITLATLGDAIDKYTTESLKDIGKTKAQCLQTIRKEYDIASKPCASIKSAMIVDFVRKLRARPGLNSPSTALNYLSHLSAVFNLGMPMWGFPLDPSEMKQAMTVCKTMGFTAKSTKRDRRPTIDELDMLLTHFTKANARRPKSAPMAKIVAFALFSTRRQDEILRITWSDYDRDGNRVLVHDMKNPGQKIGNDVWCNLPDPCCQIIDSMPKITDRIFPYGNGAVGAAFTRACKLLEIADLRFHDLRHEGASRLAELGYDLHKMKSVTGHESHSSLERYTHYRATGDRYANWSWIEKVTK